MADAKDRLVSGALIRARIAELREQIKAQRKIRADDDPFFRITDWLIEEWEGALRAAEREYVATTEAARLTGWSTQTLRARGQKVVAGEDPGPGWEGLLAHRDGTDWAFCLSTIPVKGKAAA